MPRFDSLSILGGDKQAVILDIGGAYTKCGFASEFSPRAIVPSVIEELVDGTILRTPLFTSAVTDQGRTTKEQRNLLKTFIHELYYKHLLAMPRERRVVVVESVLTPTAEREMLADVLMKDLEIPSVLFAAAPLTACFPFGCQSALVVDCGQRETQVMPVFEGVTMLNCWQATPLAGAAVTTRLRSRLLRDAQLVSADLGVVPLGDVPHVLTDTLLEDIKARCCFATLIERGRKYQQYQAAVDAGQDGNSIQLPTPPPDVKYPLAGDKTLTIPGTARESVFEALFEKDDDTKSVAQAILDSIMRCPIDLRKSMAEHLVIAGGTAMSQQFLPRIKAELLDLLAGDYRSRLPLTTVKFYLLKKDRTENYLSWLGASLFGGGASEILPYRSLSREEYIKTGVVPDWTQKVAESTGVDDAADGQRKKL